MGGSVYDRFDRDVLDAIVAGGLSGASLREILGHVDAHEKLILTREELNASLARLFAAGNVVARPGGRLATPGPDDAIPAAFVPIPGDEFEAAVDEYVRWFAATLRQIEAEESDPAAPVWPKLEGEWRLPPDQWPTDLELEGLGAVLDRLVAALADHGLTAEAGGFGVGPGSATFWINGPKSADPAAMLRVARPIFEAVATEGSTLEMTDRAGRGS